MIYNYDDFGQFFIIIDKNLTKEIFLTNVKVEQGSFAEDMFSRIYDSIFSELINLEEEFEKYYSIEYKSIQHFLFQKFCFPSDVIKDFFSLKSQSESYCIFYKHEKDSYGDYSITRYAFSDEMYEKVTSTLLLKDYEN